MTEPREMAPEEVDLYRTLLADFAEAMLDKAWKRFRERRMDGTELRRVDP